jgi:two-component system response regulator
MTGEANKLPVVLVAEDHQHDRFILSEVFARAGIQADLRFVGDGEQVLDYLHRSGPFAGSAPGNDKAPSPCFILLDLNMPRLDGRKTIRVLRADPKLCHLPVIALSTSEHPQHIAEAYAIGANAYLVKPARIPDYVSKINALWQFWMHAATLPTPEEVPTLSETA